MVKKKYETYFGSSGLTQMKYYNMSVIINPWAKLYPKIKI